MASLTCFGIVLVGNGLGICVGECSKYLLTRFRHLRRLLRMTLTITRENEAIFRVKSDLAYWSDGQCIDERMAFNERGKLSNSNAQTIDRQAGKRYVLVVPFGIKHPAVVKTAQGLAVGESAMITL